MKCEEVREQLPDYVLATLSETEMAAVRRHLRGCAACREEAFELDHGVAIFATAAHAIPPPEDLKDRVTSVLAEEWNEAPAVESARSRPPLRMGAVAAAIAVLAGALAWGGVAQSRANGFHRDATAYRQFLQALGGRDVRVAVLSSPASRVEGSAIMYDSDVGQSWVLVLARSRSYRGTINVALVSKGGRSMMLRAIQIGPGGEGSTWLVTSADISAFTRVRLTGPAGRVLATGSEVGH
jgi:anti-sigma factor RsiW